MNGEAHDLDALQARLRHRFATQAYNGTHDLRAVQQLLGHSRPETTARYTLTDDDALTAAVLAGLGTLCVWLKKREGLR